MRKLALAFVFVILLAGCANTERDERQAKRAKEIAEQNARPNVIEQIQGPGDHYYIRKWEVEFSDGTRVGCVSIGAAKNVSCVKLGSI